MSEIRLDRSGGPALLENVEGGDTSSVTSDEIYHFLERSKVSHLINYRNHELETS